MCWYKTTSCAHAPQVEGLKTRALVREMASYMRRVNPQLAEALIGAPRRPRRPAEGSPASRPRVLPAAAQRVAPLARPAASRRTWPATPPHGNLASVLPQIENVLIFSVCDTKTDHTLWCCWAPADERDQHMVESLSRLEGRVVAVVGLAHLDGIERRWEALQHSPKALAR